MKVNSRTQSCTSKNLNFHLKSISGRFPSRISRQADSDGTPKLKFRHRDIVPENLRSKRKSLRHSNRMHKNNNGFHVSPTGTVHSELSKSLNTVQTKAKFESDSQKEPHSLGSPHHSIHNRSVNWGTSTGKQWFNVSQRREPQKHIQSFIQETTGRNNVTYDQAASLQSTRYLQELSDGHFQHQHGKISLKTKTTPF